MPVREEEELLLVHVFTTGDMDTFQQLILLSYLCLVDTYFLYEILNALNFYQKRNPLLSFCSNLSEKRSEYLV